MTAATAEARMTNRVSKLNAQQCREILKANHDKWTPESPIITIEVWTRLAALTSEEEADAFLDTL